MADTAVFYLARPVHNIRLIERFVAAYRRCPPGESHELVVIFKGFGDDREALSQYRARLAPLTFTPVEVPDERFDLGAYLAVAAVLNHRWVCCLNSYAEPLADGWLAHLLTAARSDGVGVAGATGSYETPFVAWGYLVGLVLQLPRRFRPLAWLLPSPMFRWVARHWLPPPRPYSEFPPFPNPHVRTNGFVISRELFLDLDPGPLADKWDALRLESGTNGMTRQLLRRGLRPVLVGRGGQVFEVGDWPQSRTFRSGDQENLLVGDNHTQHYAEAPPEERALLARLAWGSEVVGGENHDAAPYATLSGRPPDVT